jgi:hypothetical protein
MPPEWLTTAAFEYARRAGIVPKADWVCRNCALNSRGPRMRLEMSTAASLAARLEV